MNALRQFMGKKIGAFLMFGLFCSGSYGWELIRDFNAGSDGIHAGDSFDGAAGLTAYSAFPGSDGTITAKASIEEGVTGFGKWGGIINFPERIFAGDELWFSMDFYIPASFIIDTPTNGSLKFLRFRSAKADGSHNNYIDIQLIDDDKASLYDFRMIREGQNKWFKFGERDVLQRDHWHTIAVNIQFEEQLKSDGGNSAIYIWLDNELLTMEPSFSTIRGEGSYFKAFYLFTYWNGKSPQDQSVWIDNIKMSDSYPKWAESLKDLDRRPVLLTPIKKIH